MALLPKHVLFKERGIKYALHVANNAYNSGINPVIIEGNSEVQFCKEVESLLRQKFPIKSITGTLQCLTVTFDQSKR